MAYAEKNRLNLRTTGIFIALIGVLAAIFPLVTGLALSFLFGGLLIIGAMGHLAQAFSRPDWKGSIWALILSVIYVFAGITLLVNPIFGLAALTVLVFLQLVATGIIEVIWGFQLREKENSSGMILSGILSILIAGLIASGWPSTARWAIGLLFGFSLISTGISMIIYSNAEDKTEE